MCRLLAIKTTEGFSSEYLEGFRKLAEHGKVRRGAEPGHKDGWGIVLYEGSIPRYLAREPKGASDDPKYIAVTKALIDHTNPGIMIAHLRKAGRNGSAPSVQNTHPFIEGKWTFAHNGGIKRFNVKPPRLQGITDSERFFRLLISRVARANSFEGALRWSVSFVKRNFKYSSLNFVLSDGNMLCGYRDCNEDEDYYSLLYKKDSSGVVFSQEPLDKGSWKDIPNRSIAVVKDDLDIEVRPLG